MASRWDILVDIMTINDTAGNPRKLFWNYCQLTVDKITTHAKPFQGLVTRRAQNSLRLYYCILSSLSEEARTKILTESNKFHISANPVGKLLFKLLMQKAN